MNGMLWMRAARKGRKGRFRDSDSSMTARVWSVARVMSTMWVLLSMFVFYGWDFMTDK